MKKVSFFKGFKIFSVIFLFFILGSFFTPFYFAESEPVSLQTSQTSSGDQKRMNSSVGDGLGLMAAALAASTGAIGAGIAIAASAPAALGAFSENPSSFGKTIVFVALGEGVAILPFIIAMIIAGRF